MEESKKEPKEEKIVTMDAAIPEQYVPAIRLLVKSLGGTMKAIKVKEKAPKKRKTTRK